MRDLILMRGVPGSGKSTWIKQNGLEQYTVSSDRVRLCWSAPVPDAETGVPKIILRNSMEVAVWNDIEQMVDYRMQNGQFVIIDAQNSKPSRWKKFAEKYRYRIWVKQMDTPLDVCLKQNKEREAYKFVPEDHILAAWQKQHDIQYSVSIKPVTEELISGVIEPMDVSSFNRVFVIGDVHGCFTPLQEFFDFIKGPKDDDLYVFVGDYLDRGLENRATLEFLIKYRNNRNFWFLEGNHVWERLWAEGKLDEIKSQEFLAHTMPQIEAVDKKAVREWCSRWIQMAYFTFHGQRYFVTHAGMGFMPAKLRFIPTRMFVKGESYNDDVDKWWHEKHTGVIQIHGHRNNFMYDQDSFDDSVNLCNDVEFGEYLEVHQLGPGEGQRTCLHFHNPNPRTGLSSRRKKAITDGISAATPQEEVQLFVELMRDCKDIVEKPLTDRISSFNFSRTVFYKDEWNAINQVARGLFIDTQSWTIAARSYPKFFNFEERDKNSLEWLKENIKFPVIAYRKYNGFLGLVSYDHTTDQLAYFSKTSNASPHAKITQEVIESYMGPNIDKLRDLARQFDATFVFEICTSKDPHIIYEGERPVLLDIIYNRVAFKKLPYNMLAETAKCLELPVKQADSVYDTWEWLEPALVNHAVVRNIGTPIEGYVFQDANGYNVKSKCYYYKWWREMREIKNRMGDKPLVELQYIFKDVNEDTLRGRVIKFMMGLEPGFRKSISIIDVRTMYLKENPGDDVDYMATYKDRSHDETKEVPVAGD